MIRNNLKIAGIALLGLTATVGCKKESAPPTAYTAAATINGQLFTSSANSTVDGPLLEIFFAPKDPRISGLFPYLNIGITTFVGAPGTFNIDGVSATANIDSSETAVIPAIHGSLTISAVSASTITGSFNFTCSDSTRVTNGSFVAGRN